MPVVRGDLVWAACRPVLKLVAEMTVGVALSKAGILTPVGTKMIATMLISVFYPCLIFSNIITGISLSNMSAVPIMVIDSVAIIVLGLLVGFVILKLFKPPIGFRYTTVLATSMGSFGDLTLAILMSVGDHSPFSTGDSQRGVAYMAAFLLFVNIYFFSFAFKYFGEDYTHLRKHTLEKKEKAEREQERKDMEKTCERFLVVDSPVGVRLPPTPQPALGGATPVPASSPTTSKINIPPPRTSILDEVPISVLDATDKIEVVIPRISIDSNSSSKANSIRSQSSQPLHTPSRSISSAVTEFTAGGANNLQQQQQQQQHEPMPASPSSSSFQRPNSANSDGSKAKLVPATNPEPNNGNNSTTARQQSYKEIPASFTRQETSLSTIAIAHQQQQQKQQQGHETTNTSTSRFHQLVKKSTSWIHPTLLYWLQAFFTIANTASILALVIISIPALYNLLQPSSPRTTSSSEPALLFLFEGITFLGQGAVPLAILNLGGALGRLKLTEALADWKLTLAISTARLLIIPGIVLGIVEGVLVPQGFVNKSDKMLRFVLVLPSCVPTASATVFFTQMWHPKGKADRIAGVVLAQYLAGMVTMTFMLCLIFTIISES